MTRRRHGPDEPGAASTAPGEHPSDRGEATKPAATILRQEISIGAEQLERRASGLVLSAVSAGLDIGFGPMMVATMLAIAPDGGVGTRLALSLVYGIGFVIVILGRSELFTEHTTLAVLPLLSRQTTFAKVARLWVLVYAGNLLGVIVFAALAAPLGIGLGLYEPHHLSEMAAHLVRVEPGVAFVSAVAAGWLMGLVSWLVTAARDTVGQIIIILLVAGAIAFLGLHHSIAGSIEVLLAVFGADLGVGDWIRFLVLVTLGNAVGGVVMVALLKYGHVTNIGPTPSPSRRA